MNNSNGEVLESIKTNGYNPHEFEGLSIAEHCQIFGEILGLDAPVSEQVLRGAIRSSTYAVNLLVCRQAPALMQQLLRNPPPEPSVDLSPLELAKNAAKALFKWSQEGLASVSDDIWEKRLNICDLCPNLAPVRGKSKPLFEMTGTHEGSENKCSVCGCPVIRKSRMVSEHCPDRHPVHQDQTRWGEPLPPNWVPPVRSAG